MRRLLALVFVPFIVSSCGGGPTTPTPTGQNTNNPPCAVNVQTPQINVGGNAGPTAFTVNAPANCAWTVTSSQPWLTITSGTGATGTGTVTFTVTENPLGQARTATITINGLAIMVTQAAGGPPLTLTTPNIPAVVFVNAPFGPFTFVPAGGTPPYRFGYETGVGFAPLGINLDSNTGTLAGAPTQPGSYQFGVCVTDLAGRSECRRVGLRVDPPATTGDAFLGNWSGTIVLRVGCFQPLPANFPWTGTFQRNGNNIVLVASVPRAFVNNEQIPVTITGQRLTFNILFDSRYTFVADFSADFRSLTGTFTGGNCNVPPTVVNPSGDWNGTRQ